MKLLSVICLSALLLGASSAFAEDSTNATTTVQTADLSAILRKLDDLDRKLSEIEREMDSVTRFLGSDRSAAFGTVDDRLREMERNLDDLKRSVDRLR